MLKAESKDVLLVTFAAKPALQPKEFRMSSYRTKVYPMKGKPC